MKRFPKSALARLLLLITFVFLILPVGSALAQELLPVGTYFYYGKQMSLEEINQIARERFSRTGEYTDCVYVPSEAYSPTRVEYNQTFHCFNSAREAAEFSLSIRAEFNSHDDSASTPPSELNNSQLASSTFWSIFAHVFHTGWLDNIDVGESFWTSTGIYSLNDFANNEVRLSDNPNYPTQRWTFGWTQYALSAGPAGARHAYHCTTAVCQ